MQNNIKKTSNFAIKMKQFNSYFFYFYFDKCLFIYKDVA